MINFNYSSMENKEVLETTSNFQTLYYNDILALPMLELWERFTIENSILSEKIFDI
jgi:hypothetical protein